MNIISVVKAEIERLKESLPREAGRGAGTITPKGYGMLTAYNELLSFLDTLEEPVCEELNEAAESFCDTLEGKEAWSYGASHYYYEDAVNAFIAGANWQAEQLLKGSPMPEDTVLFNKGVAEGRRLERQDMMAEAEDGEVVKDITNKLAVTAKINLDGFKFGDKVKLVIIRP